MRKHPARRWIKLSDLTNVILTNVNVRRNDEKSSGFNVGAGIAIKAKTKAKAKKKRRDFGNAYRFNNKFLCFSLAFASASA
jgi:hypothetical protein